MKPLYVIAASLVTFVVPNLVGLGVWQMGSDIHPTLRSLTAILGWVVTFGLSTVLFWRLIKNAFPMTEQ